MKFRISEEKIVLAVVLGIVALLYADILLLGHGLYLNDLILYHYPMKHIVRDAIAHGEFPLWNRFYSGGQPMAANPAYEVFYPLQWILYAGNFHFGFQLHVFLHFLIAAAGMYLLLRDFKVSPFASGFGALAFVLCGPYLSLANKLPLLFSLSWMPFAFRYARRYIRWGVFTDLFGAALAVGMQFLLGEPTMALQTAGLILFYAILNATGSEERGEWRRTSMRVASLFGIAILIAAVQLIPAIDYARDSVRSIPFDFRIVGNWSMPPQRALELIAPGLFRHVANERGAAAITSMYPYRNEPFLAHVYIGVVIALLAIAGFLARRRGTGPALILVGGSFLFAVGDHTPLLRILYDLHLFRGIRYPEKFIITGAFILIIWAAMTLDDLIAGERRVVRNAKGLAIVWVAIALLLAGLFAGTTPALETGRYFAMNAGRAVIAAGLLFMAAGRRRKEWVVAIAAFTVADLWYVTRDVVPRMPREYFEAPHVAGLPPVQQGQRLFHEAAWQAWDDEATAAEYSTTGSREATWWYFRNAMFPNIPAYAGYELALEDDIDRTSLKTTDAFREAFKSARATRDARAIEPYLRMTGANYIVQLQPFTEAARQTLLSEPGRIDPVVVRKTGDYPRFWFAGALEEVTGAGDFAAAVARQPERSGVAYVSGETFAPSPGRVISAKQTGNSVVVRAHADGRAFLVFAVTGHKYWNATIDGRDALLVPVNVAFQGIVVPAGEHAITLRYRNPLLPFSGLLTVGVLTAVALLTWRGRKRRPADSQ